MDPAFTVSFLHSEIYLTHNLKRESEFGNGCKTFDARDLECIFVAVCFFGIIFISIFLSDCLFLCVPTSVCVCNTVNNRVCGCACVCQCVNVHACVHVMHLCNQL